MTKNKYEKLPENMRSEDLNKIFKELIKEIDEKKINYNEGLEIMLDLSDKQWHTYEKIDSKLGLEIENILIKLNDFESVEIVDKITLIITRLGLKNIYNMYKESLNNKLKKEVKQVIEDLIEEIGEEIENPYSGM